MKLLTIALLSVSLATSAVAADDPTASVKEAAAGWQAAAVKQDLAGLKRYLADDLQYAHAGGQVQNKDQYIAAVLKGPPRYETFTFADLKIQFYGKAAVLTAFCDVKMVGQDNFRVRTLQVYVENNGQWQMAAHQSTRMGR
jgi:ketosteroid isomerase-like protein